MVINKRLVTAALAMFMVTLIIACASKPFLKVQYQLPPSSTALTGESLFLQISDQRIDQTFLSSNAKNALNNFNGTYSLVVLRDDGSGNLIGAYDLNSLWREIFKQRLANEGVTVSASKESTNTSLEIQIKEFKLDIVNRKWMLQMSYQAALSKDNTTLAKETINGSAERLKVMGKSDAEKILGELVTDMVNKLDVARLYQQVR
jgi:hypothetical protein